MKESKQLVRKVRADFDPTATYKVDVRVCTEEQKKQVQQAFFDAGFVWEYDGKVYEHLHATEYTNTLSGGVVTPHLMYSSSTYGFNMSAKEFLDLVYEPKQQGHVHAELMVQYAEDAKTTDKPWELWEVRLGSSDWADCTVNLLWVTNCEYRRKSKTHIVNGIEIPDLRITPDFDQHYWYPDPSEVELVLRILRRKWSSSDNHRIANNLCYEHSDEGREAAIMHSKAWLGIA